MLYFIHFAKLEWNGKPEQQTKRTKRSQICVLQVVVIFIVSFFEFASHWVTISGIFRICQSMRINRSAVCDCMRSMCMCLLPIRISISILFFCMNTILFRSKFMRCVGATIKLVFSLKHFIVISIIIQHIAHFIPSLSLFGVFSFITNRSKFP